MMKQYLGKRCAALALSLLLAVAAAVTLLPQRMARAVSISFNSGADTEFKDVWSQSGMRAEMLADGSTYLQMKRDSQFARMNNAYPMKLDGLEFTLHSVGFMGSVYTVYLYPAKDANGETTPEIAGKHYFEVDGQAIFFSIGVGFANNNDKNARRLALAVGSEFSSTGNATADGTFLAVNTMGGTSKNKLMKYEDDTNPDWSALETDNMGGVIDLKVKFTSDGADGYHLDYEFTPSYTNTITSMTEWVSAQYDENGNLLKDENGRAVTVTDKTAPVAQKLSGRISLSADVIASKFSLPEGVRFDEVMMGVAPWLGNTTPSQLELDYTDDYRKAYEAQNRETFEAMDAKIRTVEEETAALREDADFDELALGYRKTVALEQEIAGMTGLREKETGVWKLRASECRRTVENLFGSDGADALKLLGYETYIEVFEESVKDLSTDAKIDKAIADRQNCGYMELLDIAESTSSSAEIKKKAESLLARYNAAGVKLTQGRDAMCLLKLTALEEAVSALGSQSDLSYAMSLIADVDLNEASDQNFEGYEARFDAALDKLRAGLVSQSGDLLKVWETYASTLFSDNGEGGILFESRNGFSDATRYTVGATAKQLVDVDGFTVEFLPEWGNNVIGSWYGVHLVSAKESFSAYGDDLAGKAATKGLIGLIVPYAANVTEIQLFCGETYQRDNIQDEAVGYPKIGVDLFGKKVKMEYLKETDAEGAEVYNIYVTLSDPETGTVLSERQIYHSIAAETVEEVLPGGKAYFQFGAWDQDRQGLGATILTINGKEASAFLMDTLPDNEDGNDAGGCAGCGSAGSGAGLGGFLGGMAAVAACGLFLRKVGRRHHGRQI